jgi:hypothetical protein
MKNTLQNAVKTSVAAVTLALAFSGASYAADATFSVNPLGGSHISDAGAKLFKPTAAGTTPTQSTVLYEMTNDDNEAENFFAYCIAPAIDIGQDAVYTANYNATVKDSVKALYEMAYAGTVVDIRSTATKANQMAFQLALWELNNDDGNLFATDGKQYFSQNTNLQVEAAQKLINSISGYTLKNLYSYTTFTGIDAVTKAVSQEMLSVSAVSAVPEVDTWAMIAAGLGLVGVMSRRRRKEDVIGDEKFA